MSSTTDRLRQYLQQQSHAMQNPGDFEADNLLHEGQINVHHSSLVPVQQTNEQELNDFKEQVKSWLRLDNELKAINAKIKVLDNERKHRKNMMEKLSETILKFMNMNEIDELNSREGIIKYRKSLVMAPLTQKKMIERLKEQFQSITDVDERLNKVFKDREKVPKLCLKRC